MNTYPKLVAWLTRHRVAAFLAVVAAKYLLALLRLAFYVRFQYGQWYNFVSYWDLASLAARGAYPYIHYWVEYPPVFPWVLTALYGLSLAFGGAAQVAFYVLVALLLVTADCAILFLVYRLGQRVYGDAHKATACGLIYTLLFLPVYIYTGWFDTLPTALALLAILLIVDRRPSLAGVVTALGALCKVFPLVAVPIGWLYLDRQKRRSFILWGLVTAVVVLLPLALFGPTMTLASARGYLQRSSWETIWALVDGYAGSGGHPPPETRLDPNQLSWIQHPSLVPGWLLPLALLALVIVALARVRRPLTPMGAIVLSSFLASGLLLFSKGYSPQYLIWILPWLALVAVERPIWLVPAAGLAVANLIEYPGYFHFFPQQPVVLIAAVLLRTGMLIWALVLGGPGRVNQVRAP
jgi:hypothetical protein